MSGVNFVIAAWVVTTVVIAAYVFWMLRRGRKLSESLPEAERRWTNS